MFNIEKKKSIRFKDDFSYFVTFNYSPVYVELVKSCLNRIYHYNEKMWEIPLKELDYLRNKLDENGIQYKVTGEPNIALNIANKSPIIKQDLDISCLDQYDFKTMPYKHQKEGIVFGLQNPKFLLGDDMGCIDESTIIQCRVNASTFKYTIKQAFERFHRKNYNSFKVRCLKEDYFGQHLVQNILFKGEKVSYKLILENGLELIATPDHEILTQRGYVPLIDLIIEKDFVITNGKTICKNCGTSENLITYPNSKYLGYCKKCMYQYLRNKPNCEFKRFLIKGYWFLRGPQYLGHHLMTCCGLPEHQLIAEQKYNRKLDLSYEVVHHIDYNSQNNNPDNLVVLTKKEHAQLHSSEKFKHFFNHNYKKLNGTEMIVVPNKSKVVAIQYIGLRNVYDIIMEDPYRNFVANKIVVHNCGKTLMTLNIARIKKELEGFKHCLVIVGYNTLKDNWLREIKKHTTEKGHILGTRHKKDGRCFIGSVQDRLEDLSRNDIDAFFLITNIETLRYAEKSKCFYGGKWRTKKNYILAQKVNDLCKQNKIGMIVIDEFQTCKNITSDQTKAILKIKDCPNLIAATGTPIMNRAMDSYPLLKWLQVEDKSYKQFQDRYCIMGGFRNTQVIDNKNMDELHNKIQPVMLRRLKEDVLDLPDKVYIDDYLEMNLKQQKFYEQIRNETLNKIEEMKNKKDLTWLLRLRQVTSNPIVLDEKINESIKFDRLQQLLEEIISNNRKAIIFSNWARIIKLAYDKFSCYNPVMIIGEIKEGSERQKQVDIFQEDPNCKIILGTIGAMGTGLTLTAACNVIFIDEPWNRALKDQASDRAHRIGAKETVFVRTLICTGTLDEKVNALVKQKGELADLLIDGNPKDYNLFINYLFDL